METLAEPISTNANIHVSNSEPLDPTLNPTEYLTYKIKQWWDKFNKEFKSSYPYPSISFDLKSIRVAGRAYLRLNTLDFNLNFFKDDKKAFEEIIIPHEIAHLFHWYILIKNGTIILVNGKYVKASPSFKFISHGKTWKNIMRFMGIQNPTRLTKINTTIGRKNPYVYRCSCQTHSISKNIHHKIVNGKRYHCKKCKTTIFFDHANL